MKGVNYIMKKEKVFDADLTRFIAIARENDRSHAMTDRVIQMLLVNAGNSCGFIDKRPAQGTLLEGYELSDAQIQAFTKLNTKIGTLSQKKITRTELDDFAQKITSEAQLPEREALEFRAIIQEAWNMTTRNAERTPQAAEYRHAVQTSTRGR